MGLKRRSRGRSLGHKLARNCTVFSTGPVGGRAPPRPVTTRPSGHSCRPGRVCPLNGRQLPSHPGWSSPLPNQRHSLPTEMLSRKRLFWMSLTPGEAARWGARSCRRTSRWDRRGSPGQHRDLSHQEPSEPSPYQRQSPRVFRPGALIRCDNFWFKKRRNWRIGCRWLPGLRLGDGGRNLFPRHHMGLD